MTSSRTNMGAQPPLPTGVYCNLQDLMALRLVARSVTLPKAKRVSRPQSGSHFSRFRGRGMEFSEVRAYQPGDDVRSIDWRVTARRQKPHTKLFNEERERPVFIVCDQSQSQFFGSQRAFKSVRAAEAAALFAWTALNHNDRVGGIVFSERGHQEVKPARSRKNLLRLLSSLCDFNNALKIGDSLEGARFSLDDALVETGRLVKPGTLIVVVSDFFHTNPETRKQLSMLAQHNDLVLTRTFDPLENELPPPGLYPVSDGDNTLLVNTLSDKTRRQYQQWVKEHLNGLDKLANQCRARLINISTHEDAAHAIRHLLASLS